MEYADSGDLHAHIKRQKDEVKKDFVESQVRNWLVQLGFALQHLHKMRIMHRDLKPANVFMTNTKLLKLGDFGVSKVLDANTHFAQTQVCIYYIYFLKVYLKKSLMNDETKRFDSNVFISSYISRSVHQRIFLQKWYWENPTTSKVTFGD